MIYIKVPKEITEYQQRTVLGLTIRQLKFITCGCGVGLVISFALFPLFGWSGASVIVTVLCAPFIALSFLEKDGMSMDVYMKYKLRFYMNKQRLAYEMEKTLYHNEREGINKDGTFMEKIKYCRERRKQVRYHKKILENGKTKKQQKKENRTKHHTVSKDV